MLRREEAEKLVEKGKICRVRVEDRRRSIFGIPIEVTVCPSLCLYEGTDALKVASYYRRGRDWIRSMRNYIIPLCVIRGVEEIEE